MRLLTAIVLGVALCGAVPALAEPASQQMVEEALTCQCGCGLTVHSCNHLRCGSGEPIKKEIAERIARGEDQDTIVASFVQRYGEKILSAPTFRGFNWFAWITPFFVVVVAGGALAMAIRRHVRTDAPAPAEAGSGAPAGDPTLRQRLAHELDAMDRE